jgi:hypothetical protein
MKALAAFLLASMILQGGSQTAKAHVDDFYAEFFARMSAPRPVTDLQIGYSRDFTRLIAENHEACRQRAEGPCGWGSYGDEYLQRAQDIEVGLSLERAGYRSTELEPGVVRVQLNIYPSLTDAGDYYKVDMTYRLIREAGVWRVDDIRYADGKTARQQIRDEIDELKSAP